MPSNLLFGCGRKKTHSALKERKHAGRKKRAKESAGGKAEGKGLSVTLNNDILLHPSGKTDVIALQ